MSAQWQQIEELLQQGLEAAAAVVGSRLERGVQVVPARPPESSSLLRFDLRFGAGGTLSWFVSNEDATGFSDMLIGGEGDRAAALTEMHLDALSSTFSDMLEAGVAGINRQLDVALEAGSIDMNMESRLPIVDSGGVQALLALEIERFGNLVVVQQADPVLVAALASQLGEVAPSAAADPSPAEPSTQAPAVPPEADSAPAGSSTAPAASGDNVVELPGVGTRAASAGSGGRDLQMLLNVPLDVTVEIGRAKQSVQQLLELGVGSILELGKLAGDPMDILVNGKVLARGEVVVIDEEFGIRITEILTPEQRLRSIG